MAMKVDEGTFLSGCGFCLDPIIPELFVCLFIIWCGGEQNRMKSDLKCTLICGEQLPKCEPFCSPSGMGRGHIAHNCPARGMLLLASSSPRTAWPGATVTWGEILCTVCLSTPPYDSGLHGPSLDAGVPQRRTCHIPSILILLYARPAS